MSILRAIARVAIVVSFLIALVIARSGSAGAQGSAFNPGQERYAPVFHWIIDFEKRTAAALMEDHMFDRDPSATTAFYDRLTGTHQSADQSAERQRQHVTFFDGPNYPLFGFGKNGYGIVYDPQRRIIYYGNGCCAFGREVLAYVDVPPPSDVARASLRYVRTLRGIHLGMTTAQVRWLEGPNVETADAATHAGVLTYATLHGDTCATVRKFVFRNHRLVAMHVAEGC